MTLCRRSSCHTVIRLAKYGFGRLAKQWYHCSIYLIDFNIPPVFSIIAWHFIRKYHLVYIDRKFVSYLSLLVKKSLDGTSIRPNLNIFIMYIFRLSISDGLPKFFSLFFLVFRNTSVPPSWWMPSNGHWLFHYLLLFLLSGPCLFDAHCITQ